MGRDLSPEQNAFFRAIAVEYMAAHQLGATAFGRVINLAQSGATDFLDPKKSRGISWDRAKRLAAAAGFDFEAALAGHRAPAPTDVTSDPAYETVRAELELAGFNAVALATAARVLNVVGVSLSREALEDAAGFVTRRRLADTKKPIALPSAQAMGRDTKASKALVAGQKPQRQKAAR